MAQGRDRSATSSQLITEIRVSDKIVINSDQIVSKKSGWVTFIDDGGTQRKARASSIEVRGEGEQLSGLGQEIASTTAVEGSTTTEGEEPVKEKKVTKAKAKAKAKAKKASKVRTEGGVRTIAGKTFDLSRYNRTKAPSGGVSYNNGDAVADLLDGKSLEQVYEIAAKKLKVDEKELRAKYKNLNVGMQRMNLGNRLRKVMLSKGVRAA